MSAILLSDKAWGIYGSLLFVFCLLLILAGAFFWLLLGGKCVLEGARLIPPRTWRRVDAVVERVNIIRDADSNDYVRIHYRFEAGRPGAESEIYRGSATDHGPWPWTQDRKVLADQHRAAGKMEIWYAEESPSIQYRSRPHPAWHSTKGLLAVALGLLILLAPVYLLKLARLGLGP